MLERRDHGLQVTEPTEQVNWQEWWLAIDKRVQEHLTNEREIMIDAVGEALAMQRRELYDDERFRGPPGRPGKDAKLPRVKIWQEDAVYYEGDCVAFGGSLYQAQCDTGKSPLFAKNWMCLATAGADGKPIRHRGEFQAVVEYREHAPCWSTAVHSWRCAMILVHVRDAVGRYSQPRVKTARTARLASEVNAASAG